MRHELVIPRQFFRGVAVKMQTNRADAKVKSIGNYTLGKTIGCGTFGKVKLGTHSSTGSKVAIKILEKQKIADAADIERVSREIHILKLVRHPHIIQLFEIVETTRQLYVVMEYASGGELFDYIVSKKRLDEREACQLFRQMVSGIEFMHAKGIAHRDLKPENLLLDDSRMIKIVDFGLSNMFRPGESLQTACGSPCYASPEMIRGKAYDPQQSDVWSAGVILFAMTCGYLPFEDANTADLYKKVIAGEFSIPTFVSPELRILIQGMLSTDPRLRMSVSQVKRSQWYQSAAPWDASADAPCGTDTGELDQSVLAKLTHMDLPLDYVIKCLKLNKHNHATTTYHLLLRMKNFQPAPPCPVYSLATPVAYAARADPPRSAFRSGETIPLPFGDRLSGTRIPSSSRIQSVSPIFVPSRTPSFRDRTEAGMSTVRLSARLPSTSFSSRARSASPSFVGSSVGRPPSARQSPFMSSSLTRPTMSAYAKMKPPQVKAPFGSTTRRLDIVTPPPKSARMQPSKPVLTFSTTRPFPIPLSTLGRKPGSPRSARPSLIPSTARRPVTQTDRRPNPKPISAFQRPLIAIGARRSLITAR